MKRAKRLPFLEYFMIHYDKLSKTEAAEIIAASWSACTEACETRFNFVLTK